MVRSAVRTKRSFLAAIYDWTDASVMPRLTCHSSYPEDLMTQQAPDKVVIGIDVGSTTVKMTVVDPATKEILWSKYLRHETRKPEMTRDMLKEIHEAYPTLTKDQIRVFITGSGG